MAAGVCFFKYSACRNVEHGNQFTGKVGETEKKKAVKTLHYLILYHERYRLWCFRLHGCINDIFDFLPEGVFFNVLLN